MCPNSQIYSVHVQRERTRGMKNIRFLTCCPFCSFDRSKSRVRVRARECVNTSGYLFVSSICINDQIMYVAFLITVTHVVIKNKMPYR